MAAHIPSCQLLEEGLEQLLQLRLYMINCRKAFRHKPTAQPQAAPPATTAPPVHLPKHTKTPASVPRVTHTPLAQLQQPEAAAAAEAASSNTSIQEEVPQEDTAAVPSSTDTAAMTVRDEFCDELSRWWEQHPGNSIAHSQINSVSYAPVGRHEQVS